MKTEEEINEINDVEAESAKDVQEVKEKQEEKKPKHEHHKKNNNEELIEKLTNDLALEKEKSMRIQAEMMNFKRRKEEEVSNMYKYANEDILKRLISILDNFERALSLEDENNKEFLKGFNMIYNNILKILKENEVTEIDALNKEFDPTYHQAVLTESVDGVESGIIIDVLQKGYMYKDKVLRASMVKVSE